MFVSMSVFNKMLFCVFLYLITSEIANAEHLYKNVYPAAYK